MVTDIGPQEIWLPLQLFHDPSPTPQVLYISQVQFPCSKMKRLQWIRSKILFKAEILGVNILNSVSIELLLCGESYAKQKMALITQKVLIISACMLVDHLSLCYDFSKARLFYIVFRRASWNFFLYFGSLCGK